MDGWDVKDAEDDTSIRDIYELEVDKHTGHGGNEEEVDGISDVRVFAYADGVGAGNDSKKPVPPSNDLCSHRWQLVILWAVMFRRRPRSTPIAYSSPGNPLVSSFLFDVHD